MIEVRPTNILTFSLELADRLSYGATYYMGHAHMLGKNGAMFSAYVNDVPCAVAVMDILPEERAAVLEYIAVVEEYRGRGICGRLLHTCIEHAKRLNMAEIRARITYEEDTDAPVAGLLRESGFEWDQSSVTVVIDLSKQTIYEWFTFLKTRGNRLIRRTEKRGFTTLTYREAGREMLEAIASQAGTRFPPGVDPLTPRLEVLMDNSYVTLKDGKPAAYCQLATADCGKNLIVQGLASAFEYMRRGVFFPSLANVVSDTLTVTRAEKCAFTFYSVNRDMKGMLDTFLNFTDKAVKKQDFYKYRVANGSADE